MADAFERKTRRPGYYVIGLQLPSPKVFWKIPYLRSGLLPLETDDTELPMTIQRCALEKKTLTATFRYDVLSFADIVIIGDHQIFLEKSPGNGDGVKEKDCATENMLEVIGQHMQGIFG